MDATEAIKLFFAAGSYTMDAAGSVTAAREQGFSAEEQLRVMAATHTILGMFATVMHESLGMTEEQMLSKLGFEDEMIERRIAALADIKGSIIRAVSRHAEPQEQELKH